jgi:hypothetical protein
MKSVRGAAGNASAIVRPVEIHAYADRIFIRQDGRMVGEHRRNYGRGEAVCDPWHHVPVLVRKPGALRNEAPFRGSPSPNCRATSCRRKADAYTVLHEVFRHCLLY